MQALAPDVASLSPTSHAYQRFQAQTTDAAYLLLRPVFTSTTAADKALLPALLGLGTTLDSLERSGLMGPAAQEKTAGVEPTDE